MEQATVRNGLTAWMRRAAGAVIVACALLAIPGVSAAPAAERFASPTGAGDPAACSLAAPCSIHDAVEHGSVSAADVVTVLPGTYDIPDTVDINESITVRGQPGAAAPLLQATAAEPQVLRSDFNVGAVVQDLVLRSDFATFAGVLGAQTGNVFQRLRITAGGTTGGATAAVVANGAILRDSIVLSTPTNGVGVMSAGSGGVISNVTAIATGPGASSVAATSSFGSPQTATFRNVIASGTQYDIRISDEHAGSDAIVGNVSYSNFDPAKVQVVGTDASLVNGPGNQAQAPQFVNAAAGDYHQLYTSPTRNSGSPDATTGALDVDREARIGEGLLDIGGDEFTVTPPDPAFKLGKLTRNKKKGTAVLFVTVGGPGQLGIAGKGVKSIRRTTQGGTVKLPVKPGKGKKARKLVRRLRVKGKAALKVRVTYTPAGGSSETLTRKLKLLRRR